MSNFSKKQTRKDISIAIHCAGLGLGNATRNAAIIEELNNQLENQIRFTVFTWGKSLDFFKKYSEINTNIDLVPLLDLNNKLLFVNFILNHFIILKHMFRRKYHCSIVDSDYHFLALIILRIKIFSISQAPDVLRRAKQYSYVPVNFKERITYFFREYADAFLQKKLSHKVFVPSFYNYIQDQNLIFTPLIVRKNFNASVDIKITEYKILALLSGSGIEKENFLKNLDLSKIDLFTNGDTLKITSPNILDRSKFIILQGGLSSISECISRKKRMLIFPIKNHPEQKINALTINHLNLGKEGHWDNFKQTLAEIEKEINSDIEIFCSIKTDGATIISNKIISDLGFDS